MSEGREYVPLTRWIKGLFGREIEVTIGRVCRGHGGCSAVVDDTEDHEEWHRLQDWRLASAAKGVYLNPPPLYHCAHKGCINTVLHEGEFCPYHKA